MFNQTDVLKVLLEFRLLLRREGSNSCAHESSPREVHSRSTGIGRCVATNFNSQCMIDTFIYDDIYQN